jgi:hypothetical protein
MYIARKTWCIIGHVSKKKDITPCPAKYITHALTEPALKAIRDITKLPKLSAYVPISFRMHTKDETDLRCAFSVL